MAMNETLTSEDLEFSIPGAQIIAGRTKALAVRVMGVPRHGGPEPELLSQWWECDTVEEAQAQAAWALANR